MDYPLDRIDISPVRALATLRSLAFARHHERLRDPRAARTTIHTNISIVETCRFYGVADSLTLCRVPRSCADCVQMPGCGISSDGRCESLSAPWFPNVTEFDYRLRITPAQPNGTGYNLPLSRFESRSNVFTGNVTFCPLSDMVCSVCRQNFGALAPSSDTVDAVRSQFCVGTGGCVCIAFSEVPKVHLASARDADCLAPLSIRLSSIATTVKFSSIPSRRRDPRVLPTLPRVQPAEDTCAFHSERNVQGCRSPRSCSDCLERPGCMINNDKCVDMAKTYNSQYDFRNATGDPTIRLFPSTNTTYCSADDVACSACRTDWETRRRTMTSWYDWRGGNAAFCVGDGGCVCIERCENDNYFVENANDSACFRAQHQELQPAHTLLFSAVVIILTTLFCWLLYRDERRHFPTLQAQARVIWRHMLDQTPALHLDLFGWRRYHHDLLSKGQELLAGVEDVSPVAQPAGFDFADPSAPDFEEDESSAPTATNPTALASAPLYQPSNTGLSALHPSVPTAPGLDD